VHSSVEPPPSEDHSLNRTAGEAAWFTVIDTPSAARGERSSSAVVYGRRDVRGR
jgi:hypothetical protein